MFFFFKPIQKLFFFNIVRKIQINLFRATSKELSANETRSFSRVLREFQRESPLPTCAMATSKRRRPIISKVGTNSVHYHCCLRLAACVRREKGCRRKPCDRLLSLRCYGSLGDLLWARLDREIIIGVARSLGHVVPY